jgi:hypothetical protein
MFPVVELFIYVWPDAHTTCVYRFVPVDLLWPNERIRIAFADKSSSEAHGLVHRIGNFPETCNI